MSPEENVTAEELNYLIVKRLCTEFPGLNPFEIYKMPAIHVFKMIGRVLKYGQQEEIHKTNSNIRNVTKDTATQHWAGGNNVYKL